MENMFSISHRALMRASLAVLLIDGLTGIPVKGSNARTWIEGQKPPVKKNDGWNAFLDLPAGKYSVLAEGGTYERTSVEVSVGSKLETLLLRLSPNRLYPLPPDCVRIEGRAEPGTEITLCPRIKQTAFKLLKDCKKGSESVSLFCGSNASPVGRLLYLGSPDGSSETVRIAGASDSQTGEYLLAAPLANNYPRIGTVILPAYRTTADEKGDFFAVVSCGGPDSLITVSITDREETEKEFPRGEGSTLSVSLL